MRNAKLSNISFSLKYFQPPRAEPDQGDPGRSLRALPPSEEDVSWCYRVLLVLSVRSL